jgi:hypothetical protein
MAKRPAEQSGESQRDKFIRTARDLGCDEDREAFKRTIQKLARRASAKDDDSSSMPREPRKE